MLMHANDEYDYNQDNLRSAIRHGQNPECACLYDISKCVKYLSMYMHVHVFMYEYLYSGIPTFLLLCVC